MDSCEHCAHIWTSYASAPLRNPTLRRTFRKGGLPEDAPRPSAGRGSAGLPSGLRLHLDRAAAQHDDTCRSTESATPDRAGHGLQGRAGLAWRWDRVDSSGGCAPASRRVVPVFASTRAVSPMAIGVPWVTAPHLWRGVHKFPVTRQHLAAWSGSGRTSWRSKDVV